MRFDLRFDRPPLPGCTLAPGPVDLPPRVPRRPIQWRRAARILRELDRDRTNVGKAFEMFEAVGGRGDDGLFRRFARTQEGVALLARRPVLLDLLVDRDALAAMPDGSFGRAYLDFARVNGFAADGLLRARDAAFAGLDDGIGPDRQWFFDRLTLSHDLWHVLTSYGTHEAGELALLAYSRAQGINGRLVTVFAVFGALIGGRPAQRFMREAYRRGKRSACLVVQPWEELLPLPLDAVRARLRIPPATEAHPGGLLERIDGEVMCAAG